MKMLPTQHASASLNRLRFKLNPYLRIGLIVLAIFAVYPSSHAAVPAAKPAWKARVAQAMPLLGHRNWILVVDSAYPLQTSPGVEMIETNADQLEVVQSVLDAIHNSIHVRPLISMDAELPFVPDEDAPGASAYRDKIAKLLRGYQIQSVPHDGLIANIDEAGKTFHILILKTNMTIPYSSVFIRLDCKYWSAGAEQRLRAKMSAAPSQ